MGPIEEELKEAAAASNSGAQASIPDDAFLRSAPDTAPAPRTHRHESGVRGNRELRKARPDAIPRRPSRTSAEREAAALRETIPDAESRPEFAPRPSENGNGVLEPSGRREYPFGESSSPVELQGSEIRSKVTSEKARAAPPRPIDALRERAYPLFDREISDFNDEEKQTYHAVSRILMMRDKLTNLNSKSSRELTTSNAFTETKPREHWTYSPALRESAAQVEGTIPEAYSEDEVNWVVPGGPNSRDWANGYRPPGQAPAPIRDVDRGTFPKKDDRPEFDPRPSGNPHGDLEPSGRREYPMGENYVPIAQQDEASTSEKFRAARYRRDVAERERRDALTPEARAMEDADKTIADEDRTALREATNPFRQIASADSGQATRMKAGHVAQTQLRRFEDLKNRRQIAQDRINAEQAKLDGSRFRWGNIGKWFGGLFKNRGRRRRLAKAQTYITDLDKHAATKGITDFGDETGAAVRSQAELEARIPMTGGESETFQAAKGKTQRSSAYGSGNAFKGERPLLQRIGMAAAQSLGNRAQPDGDFAPGSLVSSQLDEFMKEPGRKDQINPDTVAKWGAPAASAGMTIPEASAEEEEADEIAERARAAEAARSRRELLTDPLPRAANRMSGVIGESDEQLDTSGSRRPASVGGTVGAARGKLATWEKLERRFDDANLEYAVKLGHRKYIGARENIEATAIPQDTSALRNQAIYNEDPEQFGFYSPLVPGDAKPQRRTSMEVPEVSGDPLATTDDDARTAQESLGDRMRGREEGAGTIEGGRDFFGNGSIGGYRSSIGGYRDVLAQSPNNYDFNAGGQVNPQGPKYKSSADIFDRVNRPKRAAANPLLTGQMLFGVVQTSRPKAKPKQAPAKKSGGSSWFKPWTWGAAPAAQPEPQAEVPPLAQPTLTSPANVQQQPPLAPALPTAPVQPARPQELQEQLDAGMIEDEEKDPDYWNR